MKVAELIESRRENWRMLEQLCGELELSRARKVGAAQIARFSALYRAACADLALADAYQLPPTTVHYLHQLVGRAHNQLYRSQKFNFKAWRREMFVDLPQRLYADRTLWLAMVIFWGIFAASMFLAYAMPRYGYHVLGSEAAEQLEEMYQDPPRGRAAGLGGTMAGFYVNHNTGIGLQCFAMGLLFGIGGLIATVFNAAYLGAAFGYMLNVPQRENFLEFVTAHGPFELTAIVLSAASGMRLGFSLVDTGGLGRVASLRTAATLAMPAMGAAMLLFALAAVIEGFVSPSSAPYEVKAGIAIASVVLMLLYLVGLGFPRRRRHADG